MGQQRRVSGRFALARGTLYDGTRTEATYSGRWGVLPQLSIEPSLSLNWADLPYGSFNARLVSSRVTVTPTARMLISSLVQYNVAAHTLEQRAAAVGNTPAGANCSSSTATGAIPRHDQARASRTARLR